MSVGERLIDADALWAAGRREGALLSILVAVSAAARIEHPSTFRQHGDGAAFRAFLGARHSWNISVEHRGQQVSVDQLMWKWLRCELAHEATMPFDVQLYDPDENPDALYVRAGGAPDYCVLLSASWYRWLHKILNEWLEGQRFPT